MTDIENDYNTRIDQLRKLIKSTRNFGPAIELALNIHGITHTGSVSASAVPTFCDEILDGQAAGFRKGHRQRHDG